MRCQASEAGGDLPPENARSCYVLELAGSQRLPGLVRSVTPSFLPGPTGLNILLSNYQLDRDSATTETRAAQPRAAR